MEVNYEDEELRFTAKEYVDSLDNFMADNMELTKYSEVEIKNFNPFLTLYKKFVLKVDLNSEL